MLGTRLSYSATLFLLLSLVQAQYDAPIHNQTEAFSQFDLFKNSPLHPCPNTTLSFTLRPEPGEYSTSNITLKSVGVSNQENYCSIMLGYPVMLPTIPTPAAFFTWWPSLVVQAVGWIATLISLIFTTNNFKPGRDLDMQLPRTFWVVLPFDMARVVVWVSNSSKHC